jgi:CheY-like chemotaxis protein
MRTKLLLADDSITIQKVVGIIFASEDYELAIVDNGTAALAKAREFKPDLFLIDAVMPGMTGYEVCEEIRRDPGIRAVPILLLTGAFEPFDDEKARQCGADDFISKPFESQHLIDKVTELIDLGRQRSFAAPPPVSEAAVTTREAEAEPAMAVAAPPAPQPARTVAAPAVEPAAGALDTFSLEVEPEQRPAPPVPPAAAPEFELEMVEGTAEDDLWGAFDLEDEAAGEAAEFDESSFAVEPLAEEEAVAGDVFGFEDDSGAATQVAEDAAEGFAAQWETAEDSGFSFEEESTADFASLSAGPDEFTVEPVATAPQDLGDLTSFAPPAEQEFDLQFAPEEETVPAAEALTIAPPPAPGNAESGFDFQFEPGGEFIPAEEPLAAFVASPVAVPSPAEKAPEPIFAPEEEFVPTPEALAPAAASAAPPAPAGVEAVLSEEQLAALVSRISRDIIEKIAWEVVPDLAEIIIKDEIRKIKEGA